MRGNAVKQTTGCWARHYWAPHRMSRRNPVMVLWDSGCLAGLIAAAYPLKPCETASPVNLGKGNVGPPRRGRIASRVRLHAPQSPLTQAGSPLWVAPFLGVWGPLGTVLMRAGPRAAGLSQRCTGCPELFNVPQGPARCSRVGAWARGISRSLVVGAQGPGISAPVTGPLLRTGLLGVSWWGRRGTSAPPG